jgi:hypothetical protein
MGARRPAAPGERCTCGRQAVIVFVTDAWGEVGWCGLSDGGRRGPCVFCGAAAGHPEERCPAYRIRPPDDPAQPPDLSTGANRELPKW